MIKTQNDGVRASLRLEVQEHHATTLEASAEPTPEATTALVQAQIAAELRQPFELARGPLIRARLVRLGPDRHLFVINLHHIVTDGWSMDILSRELGALSRDGSKIKFEILEAKGNRISAQAAGARVAGDHREEPIIVDDEHFQWSFNGEYWKDELGYYRFKIRSRCPKQ